MTTGDPFRTAVAERFPGGQQRVGAALRERAALDTFRAEYQLEDSLDAIMLYLTMLLDTRLLSGQDLRRRLQLIDAAYCLEGRPRPSRDRGLRTFLHGLHQEAALGPAHERPPLYLEDVLTLLDAIDCDQTQQYRDVALLLLANASGLTAASLRELTWNEMRLTRPRVLVRVRRERGAGPEGQVVIRAADWPETVAALLRLKRLVGPHPGPVFSHVSGLPPAISTLRLVLALLPARVREDARGGWTNPAPEPEPDLLDRTRRLSAPSLTQLRDKSIIMLGFAACLTSTEARLLRTDHVTPHDHGLILAAPGRTRPTALPEGRRPGREPVSVWNDWRSRYAAERGRPAFPQILGERPQSVALGKLGLSRVVRLRARAAWLDGQYSFSSLRIGFIRTAIREGIPESLILQQSGLVCLDTVAIHVRREQLLSTNFLELLGL